MSEFLQSFARPTAHTPFYVSLAGITYPDLTYHINAQNRLVSVIEYVISGYGTILFDGEYHEVGPDMIYLLHKGDHHEYFPDKQDPFTKIFLNISGPMAKEIASLYGLGNDHIFINKELRPVFERIPQVLRESSNEQQTQIQLQLILSEILTKLAFQQGQKDVGEEAAILKNYIDSNSHRIVPISELAEQIEHSIDYCQKLFLKEFGVTPYAYQLNRKMTLAKNLLRNSNMSISEIGATLGYSDSHYFSNIFKSKIGISPTAFKKQNST